jgi:uncharacterized protein (TIGR03435 family)
LEVLVNYPVVGVAVSSLLALMTAVANPEQTGQPSTPSAQTDLPAFDVVSVKANRSNSENQSMRVLPGGRAVVTNTPLRRVILTAYELFPQQLLGGPGWLDSDRFDIVAQANEEFGPSMPGGPPGRAQQMLQRLLAERFKLAVHTETRELPVYELTLARTDGRLGPRISAANIDCMALMVAAGRGKGPMPPPSQCGGSGGSGRISMHGASMPMFVRDLSRLTGRVVKDRTGLIGGFDFDLEFAPDSGASSETSAPAGNAASLFTALDEQLGLKLRPTRAMVDVVVIDGVEYPTEN